MLVSKHWSALKSAGPSINSQGRSAVSWSTRSYDKPLGTLFEQEMHCHWGVLSPMLLVVLNSQVFDPGKGDPSPELQASFAAATRPFVAEESTLDGEAVKGESLVPRTTAQSINSMAAPKAMLLWHVLNNFSGPTHVRQLPEALQSRTCRWVLIHTGGRPCNPPLIGSPMA
jgi:hypothetical protein